MLKLNCLLRDNANQRTVVIKYTKHHTDRHPMPFEMNGLQGQRSGTIYRVELQEDHRRDGGGSKPATYPANDSPGNFHLTCKLDKPNSERTIYSKSFQKCKYAQTDLSIGRKNKRGTTYDTSIASCGIDLAGQLIQAVSANKLVNQSTKF